MFFPINYLVLSDTVCFLKKIPFKKLTPFFVFKICIDISRILQCFLHKVIYFNKSIHLKITNLINSTAISIPQAPTSETIQPTPKAPTLETSHAPTSETPQAPTLETPQPTSQPKQKRLGRAPRCYKCQAVGHVAARFRRNVWPQGGPTVGTSWKKYSIFKFANKKKYWCYLQIYYLLCSEQ